MLYVVLSLPISDHDGLVVSIEKAPSIAYSPIGFPAGLKGSGIPLRISLMRVL